MCSTSHADLYYSAGWQVLEERVGGQARAQYVWSPVYVDALVLRDRDADGNGSLEERLYAQQDANFNVTALVDGTGAVVERYAYDPFGAVTVYDASWTVRPGGSAYGSAHLYQGLRRDAATGLYHARYRDYHPALGRPLQRDPIGFAAGDPNVYRWVGNGPAGRTDPSGLVPRIAGEMTSPDPAAAAAGVGGATGGRGEPLRRWFVYDDLADWLTGWAPDWFNEAAAGPTIPTEPSLGESFIPVYGQFREAQYHFAVGVYGNDIGELQVAGAYTVLAASEVAVLPYLAKAAYKGVVKGATKVLGREAATEGTEAGAKGIAVITDDEVVDGIRSIPTHHAKKADIKQIDRIVKEEGLTIGQRENLHEEITKQGYTLGEIREIAKEIKDLYPNK